MLGRVGARRAEVQDLEMRGQARLQQVRIAILLAHAVAKREGIADDDDAIGAGGLGGAELALAETGAVQVHGAGCETSAA